MGWYHICFNWDFINSDPVVIPNPMCVGCEYIQACSFRVSYFLEYWKDLPEEDLETIKKCISWNQVIEEPINNHQENIH